MRRIRFAAFTCAGILACVVIGQVLSFDPQPISSGDAEFENQPGPPPTVPPPPPLPGTPVAHPFKKNVAPISTERLQVLAEVVTDAEPDSQMLAGAKPVIYGLENPNRALENPNRGLENPNRGLENPSMVLDLTAQAFGN